MSPSRCCRREASPSRLKSAGSVGGGRDSPVTCAPRERSHSASHAPLKPVWPVRRTRLPLYILPNAIAGDAAGISPDFPGRFFLVPDFVQILGLLIGVHRLPEALVLVRIELLVTHEIVHWPALEHDAGVARQVI